MATGRKLILIKHSLPTIVSSVPANRWQLSDVGRARCEVLAAQLADLAPDMIVTSLEPKAIETGEIVARKLGLPVSTHANLHEHDRSNILTFYEKTRFEKLVERFFASPQQLVFGRESADEAHRRFEDALHSLIEGYATSNCLAVVAHGTVITLFVSRALGLEPFAFWKRLGLPSFVVLSLPGLELLSVVESVEHARYESGSASVSRIALWQ